jgi:hypothetical protein
VGNDPGRFTDPWGLFRFGKRPLDGAPWIPVYSDNPLGGAANTEISHEHGFFEDGKDENGEPAGPDRTNIGFGPNGRFFEDPAGKDYRFDDKHYDDDRIRKALNSMGDDGDYSLWPNNCQKWAERLRERYEEIKKEEEKKVEEKENH